MRRLPGTVLKFQDWTCAQREVPYEKGQRLLLFLDAEDGTVRAGNRHVLYRVRGNGDEGEVFVQGRHFVWCGMPVDGFPQAMQPEDVLRSLPLFRECFECRKDPVDRWRMGAIHLKCDQSKVVDLKTSSDIGRRLVQEVQASMFYKGSPLIK